MHSSVTYLPGELCDGCLVDLATFLLEFLLQILDPTQYFLIDRVIKASRQSRSTRGCVREMIDNGREEMRASQPTRSQTKLDNQWEVKWVGPFAVTATTTTATITATAVTANAQ